MVLKRHHKILIGSFMTLVFIMFIAAGLVIYFLYVQENQYYNALNDKVSELNINTQTQVNSLSGSLMQLQSSLQQNQQQVNQQISLIKASNSGDFSGLINSSIPSVVTVITDSAEGTGFVINSNGYIVTNAHVLADQNGNLASGIRVITYNQQTIDAKFIGYDGNLDIALLKIPGTYQPLILDNLSNIQIGEPVIAIGNPLGLQFSVSQGIVSAINRNVSSENDLSAYIQTTAPLNPGNSGGPLIDEEGNVIGINNFKISDGENIGFALESTYIKTAINEISQQELNQTLINY